MKHLTKPRILSGACALGGVAVLCLRLWFLETGVDGRGLLVTGHPGNTLSFVLAALVLLPAIFLTLREPDAKQCRCAASPLAALGTLLGCVGFGAAAWWLLANPINLLTTVTGIIGIPSVLCVLAAAYCRFKGLKPVAPIFWVIIVFLMLLPVQLYHPWSGQTQVTHYFFPLLGSLCVLLWAYHRAALEAGTGSYKSYLLLRHCGSFFCIAAIPGSTLPVFYLTMAAWLLLDGISVIPKKDEAHEAA